MRGARGNQDGFWMQAPKRGRAGAKTTKLQVMLDASLSARGFNNGLEKNVALAEH